MVDKIIEKAQKEIRVPVWAITVSAPVAAMVFLAIISAITTNASNQTKLMFQAETNKANISALDDKKLDKETFNQFLTNFSEMRSDIKEMKNDLKDHMNKSK